MVKEAKTLNDLAERFQWHEGLDPDHIFDEEKEMIAVLRTKVPELKDEDDKFAATFLFARRHDMKETEVLLKKFFKKKAEVQNTVFEGQRIPSLKYTKILQDHPNFGNVPMVQPMGYRDNQGRMLRYLPMELDNPSSRSLQLMCAILFRHMYYIMATEPLNAWRNGTIMVLDMKNIGWNNVDLGSSGREVSKMVQGTFPTRIRAFYMLNCGPIISALTTAARLVLPKKMMGRAKQISLDELREIVPPKYLLPQYGGESPVYGMKEHLEESIAQEERLFSEGIWPIPPGKGNIAIKKEDNNAAKKDEA